MLDLLMSVGCHSNLTPLPTVLSTIVALGRGGNPALGEVHCTLAYRVWGLTLAVCQLSHSTGKILPWLERYTFGILNSKDVLCWSCKRRRKLFSSHVTGYGTLLSHLPDLPEQALVHAVKGRGILLLPGGHVTSHDPLPEAVHHLAVAHCVVGRVLTMQGKYPHKILNVL